MTADASDEKKKGENADLRSSTLIEDIISVDERGLEFPSSSYTIFGAKEENESEPRNTRKKRKGKDGKLQW